MATDRETPNDRSGVRAADVERGQDRRISQMREANEHLIVAAVRAQTLSEEAETASRLKDEFLAAAKNVQLTFAAAGSRTISGDAERLQQVIWNLLSNAIKLTPQGGRVDVVIEGATFTVRLPIA